MQDGQARTFVSAQDDWLARHNKRLSSSTTSPHIRVKREFQVDLAWWCTSAAVWNGVALAPNEPTLADPEFAGDAWGCGAWWHHRWFQLKWDEQAAQLPIVIKEMLPIVTAAAMWGHEWQGHVVTCHCDNHAVVAVLASRTSCIIQTLVPNELNSMGTYIIWTCKRCMSLLAVLTIGNHMEWRELIKVHVSQTFIVACRTYSSIKIKN